MKDVKNPEAVDCYRMCPGEIRKVFCKSGRIT